MCAGGYLLFDSSEIEEEKGARLISTPVKLRGDTSICFSFWYNMNGPNTGKWFSHLCMHHCRTVIIIFTMTGELSVVKFNMSSLDKSPIWQLYGDQGPSWKRGKVAFMGSNPFMVPYHLRAAEVAETETVLLQIHVETRRTSTGVRGDIAIDEFDEELSETPCQSARGIGMRDKRNTNT